MEQETADVLVLGAGVAGLAAASVLSQAGLRVIIIEARERIGGRIFTEHVLGYPLPIELGAEFIHGCPNESFALVEQAGLLVYELLGQRWISQNGQLAPADALRDRSGQIFRDMLSAGDAPDRSFQAFLDPYQRDPASRDAAALAASYVEGFDAADISKISIHALIHEQRAGAASDGDRAFRIASGYDRFVAALATTADPARVVTQLGLIARRVSWRRGQVTIETEAADGSCRRFTARQAVITLPLGVLQAPPDACGAVDFQPPLADHVAAARQLAMGQVFKMTLRFRERFWAHDRLPLADPMMDPQQLSFLYGRSTALPTWWTAYPAIAPQLTAWAAGPSVSQLLDQPEQTLVEQVLQALVQALDLPRSRIADALIGTHAHNWQADPFARGAYSYVTVDGMDAVHALAAPVADTLFFAGEATNSAGHTGTVHGAIATGHRAAREILAAAAQATS